MNKFQLPKKNEKTNGSRPVKIRLTTLEIVKELAEESGLSIPEVIHRMAKYCYRNVEFNDR
ncbi:hypothetical protein A2U10_07020 [Fusobacterium necrophorum subsp. funduliforme]|jgi:hypothetical protein|uniref:hypothetical protein n=1 Tax=Fusobacterium necrophorum TaxID=859 RepID=UPI0007890853|nr:hypothetical protein [Fusobacterium necrophorum]KYM38477.1 hypothetical protein A2U10_07020 [Fusobacterium necrophorum subsp. funduliforme]